MPQGKIRTGGPHPPTPPAVPAAELGAKKGGGGASSARDAATDAFDTLPRLEHQHVPDRGQASGSSLLLRFPDGSRFHVRDSLRGGSSKTAHDTVRAGRLRRGHYVDLQTVVRDHPGLRGSMTREDIVKELALTRRYLDPGAIAGVTQEGGALRSHLIVENLPTGAQQAVRDARPAARGRVTAKILRDVARKLALMHRDGKVHLDIKPDNIRLTRKGVAVPIDFNSVGDIADPPSWRAGNPSFRAPAFLLGTSERNLEVDVHSLGMTGLMLLAGHRDSPFGGFGAVGALEHLQPGLDHLREHPDQPFTRETLERVCAGRDDLRAFFDRAYEVAPELTGIILRDMLGAQARPVDEVVAKLEQLVGGEKSRHLLGKVAQELKKL